MRVSNWAHREADAARVGTLYPRRINRSTRARHSIHSPALRECDALEAARALHVPSTPLTAGRSLSGSRASCCKARAWVRRHTPAAASSASDDRHAHRPPLVSVASSLVPTCRVESRRSGVAHLRGASDAWRRSSQLRTELLVTDSSQTSQIFGRLPFPFPAI